MKNAFACNIVPGFAITHAQAALKADQDVRAVVEAVTGPDICRCTGSGLRR